MVLLQHELADLLLGVEDHGGTPMDEHPGVHAALLHHRPVGGQVAPQDAEGAVRVERLLGGPDHLAVGRGSALQRLCQRPAHGQGHAQVQACRLIDLSRVGTPPAWWRSLMLYLEDGLYLPTTGTERWTRSKCSRSRSQPISRAKARV